MTNLRSLQAGEELPPRTFGPVSRTVLALYAGGSGDHNPMHIDIDVARAAGQPDVFAHGMLSMAYLGRYLLGFCCQDQLRWWSARFTAVTPVQAYVTCSGVVLATDAGLNEVTLALAAHIEDGTQTLSGQARLEWNGRRRRRRPSSPPTPQRIPATRSALHS
jgi:acyl dehydratase